MRVMQSNNQNTEPRTRRTQSGWSPWDNVFPLYVVGWRCQGLPAKRRIESGALRGCSSACGRVSSALLATPRTAGTPRVYPHAAAPWLHTHSVPHTHPGTPKPTCVGVPRTNTHPGRLRWPRHSFGGPPRWGLPQCRAACGPPANAPLPRPAATTANQVRMQVGGLGCLVLGERIGRPSQEDTLPEYNPAH